MYKDVNQNIYSSQKLWAIQISRVRLGNNKLWYICTMKYYIASNNTYKEFL